MESIELRERSHRLFNLPNGNGVTVDEAVRLTGWTLEEILFLIMSDQLLWYDAYNRVIIKYEELNCIVKAFGSGTVFIPLEKAVEKFGPAGRICFVGEKFMTVMKDGKYYVAEAGPVRDFYEGEFGE